MKIGLKKLILLSFSLSLISCSHIKRRQVVIDVEAREANSLDRYHDKVDKCVHRYIDKGVKFAQASEGCRNIIYKRDI